MSIFSRNDIFIFLFFLCTKWNRKEVIIWYIFHMFAEKRNGFLLKMVLTMTISSILLYRESQLKWHCKTMKIIIFKLINYINKCFLSVVFRQSLCYHVQSDPDYDHVQFQDTLLYSFWESERELYYISYTLTGHFSRYTLLILGWTPPLPLSHRWSWKHYSRLWSILRC